jgi:hypothetical protein
MMGGRAAAGDAADDPAGGAEGDCAETSVEAASRKKQIPRVARDDKECEEPVTVPPRKKDVQKGKR